MIAMSGSKPLLKKLVALKRQRAEQTLLGVQKELSALRQELAALEARLSAMNGEGREITPQFLSYEHGYVQRLVSDLGECRARIARKEVEVISAREALKRVFDSEERLRREGVGR